MVEINFFIRPPLRYGIEVNEGGRGGVAVEPTVDLDLDVAQEGVGCGINSNQIKFI